MQKYCLDCGKEISSRATRCRSCAMKYKHMQGIFDAWTPKFAELGAPDSHDLEVRARQLEGLYKWWEEHPEEIEARRQQSLKYQEEHPELIALRVESLREGSIEYWSSEESRTKHSRIMKKYWADPEWRRHTLESRKKK